MLKIWPLVLMILTSLSLPEDLSAEKTAWIVRGPAALRPSVQRIERIATLSNDARFEPVRLKDTDFLPGSFPTPTAMFQAISRTSGAGWVYQLTLEKTGPSYLVGLTLFDARSDRILLDTSEFAQAENDIEAATMRLTALLRKKMTPRDSISQTKDLLLAKGRATNASYWKKADYRSIGRAMIIPGTAITIVGGVALVKTILAVQLNKRDGFASPGPAAYIPAGACIAVGAAVLLAGVSTSAKGKRPYLYKLDRPLIAGIDFRTPDGQLALSVTGSF